MPLSSDPEKRDRQLANLRSAPPPEAGNQRRRTHGGYAAVLRDRLDAKALEVFDALATDAPLRGPDGDLPRHDTVAVHMLAEALCRLEDVSANVRDFGLFDQKTGAVRAAVELERRLRLEVADHADALGMTPRSRARLGLELTRSFDLAKAMAAEAEAEREGAAGAAAAPSDAGLSDCLSPRGEEAGDA